MKKPRRLERKLCPDCQKVVAVNPVSGVFRLHWANVSLPPPLNRGACYGSGRSPPEKTRNS